MTDAVPPPEGDPVVPQDTPDKKKKKKPRTEAGTPAFDLAKYVVRTVNMSYKDLAVDTDCTHGQVLVVPTPPF